MRNYTERTSHHTYYIGWPKIGTIFVLLDFMKYLPIWNLFHCQNQVKICNNTVTKDPTTPQIHYLVKCQCLKAWIENVTSVTTNIKKLTTGNSVFIVSVNCQILQILHQMFNVSALLLDDALLKLVVTEVVLFSVIAFKTVTFHKVV